MNLSFQMRVATTAAIAITTACAATAQKAEEPTHAADIRFFPTNRKEEHGGPQLGRSLRY